MIMIVRKAEPKIYTLTLILKRDLAIIDVSFLDLAKSKSGEPSEDDVSKHY